MKASKLEHENAFVEMRKPSVCLSPVAKENPRRKFPAMKDHVIQLKIAWRMVLFAVQVEKYSISYDFLQIQR